MILLAGTAGQDGSAVIREFIRRGEPVRALVRTAAKAASLGAPADVVIVEGDMRRPETLGAALSDLERVLMISTADGQLADTQRSFIDAAKRAGVRHIVKFSGLGAALDTPFRFNGFTPRSSDAPRSLGWRGRIRARASSCRSTSGKQPRAPVKVSSTGSWRTRVSRLCTSRTSPRQPSRYHDGKAYEMTGPEAPTMDDVACMWSWVALVRGPRAMSNLVGEFPFGPVSACT